jgi:thiamine-phosphate pyrophosphorylase
MSKREALHGLYAITDPLLCPDPALVSQVDQALAGGCRIIQFRDKRPDRTLRETLARRLLEICHAYGARLLINDDLALAEAIGADGVHLGRDDPDPAAARKLLGEAAIIGVSCYNRLELAREAVSRGVDYVAFGRFFPSPTKPQAVQADLALLRQARAAIELPLVAIGGITPENGAPLIAAGADMLAVIHGVFGQPDVRQAAHRLNALFATR